MIGHVLTYTYFLKTGNIPSTFSLLLVSRYYNGLSFIFITIAVIVIILKGGLGLLTSFLSTTSFHFRLFMNRKAHVDFAFKQMWFENWFFPLNTSCVAWASHSNMSHFCDCRTWISKPVSKVWIHQNAKHLELYPPPSRCSVNGSLFLPSYYLKL